MVNAWSLLYSEINGTMDEDYPIIKKQEDEEEVSDDMVSADFPTGNFYAADTVPFSDYDGYGMDQISFGTASGVDTIDTLDFGDYIGTGSTASYVYGFDLDSYELKCKFTNFDFDINQSKETFDDWIKAFENSIRKICR